MFDMLLKILKLNTPGPFLSGLVTGLACSDLWRNTSHSKDIKLPFKQLYLKCNLWPFLNNLVRWPSVQFLIFKYCPPLKSLLLHFCRNIIDAECGNLYHIVVFETTYHWPGANFINILRAAFRAQLFCTYILGVYSIGARIPA